MVKLGLPFLVVYFSVYFVVLANIEYTSAVETKFDYVKNNKIRVAIDKIRDIEIKNSSVLLSYTYNHNFIIKNVIVVDTQCMNDCIVLDLGKIDFNQELKDAEDKGIKVQKKKSILHIILEKIKNSINIL